MLDQRKENKDSDQDHDQEDVINHDHLIIEDHVVDYLITEVDQDHDQTIQDEIIIIGIITIIIHQIKHQDTQIHILIIMMKGDISIMLHFNHKDIMII